jgi:hypothetical protein
MIGRRLEGRDRHRIQGVDLTTGRQQFLGIGP